MRILAAAAGPNTMSVKVFSAEVLLPLSYALSRPPLELCARGGCHLPTALPATAAAVAIMCRMLELWLCHQVVSRGERIGLGYRALVAALQLLGSTCLWLAAELAIRNGVGQMGAGDLLNELGIGTPLQSAQTLLGLCGIAGTALAFGLPHIWLPAVRMLTRLSRPWSLLCSLARCVSRAATGAVGRLTGGRGGAHASFTFKALRSPKAGAGADVSPVPAPVADARRVGLDAFLDAADIAAITREANLPPGRAPRQGQSRGRGEAPRARSESRELFGFRRRVRGAVGAAGAALDGVLRDDFNELGLGRGSSQSIVANTEQMTQMALAAKNEELERLTTRQHKLLSSVADTLRLLHRVTDDDDWEEKADHARLVKTCTRVQEKLEGVLRAHDEHGTYEALLALHGSAAARSADEGAARLSGSMAAGGGGSASARAGGAASAGGGGFRDPCCSPDPAQGGAERAGGATLTWTSAMGVSDVHSRLYSGVAAEDDVDDRGRG